MEISRRTAGHALVFVLVTVGLIGCKQAPPPTPTVSQNPVPPQPTPPPPCKPTGKFQASCFSLPADTPVVVWGGSIGANAKAAFQGSNQKFQVPTTNAGWLSFDGFDGFPPSQQFSGWVLRISNRSKNNSEKLEAIKICSNKQCDGASLDPNNLVYIKIRSGAWMTMPSNNELLFHDSECDASGSTSDDRQCDFFMKLRVKSQGNPEMVAKCANATGDGFCAVGIGKAP